jgi:hypothetical protein
VPGIVVVRHKEHNAQQHTEVSFRFCIRILVSKISGKKDVKFWRQHRS